MGRVPGRRGHEVMGGQVDDGHAAMGGHTDDGCAGAWHPDGGQLRRAVAASAAATAGGFASLMTALLGPPVPVAGPPPTAVIRCRGRTHRGVAAPWYRWRGQVHEWSAGIDLIGADLSLLDEGCARLDSLAAQWRPGLLASLRPVDGEADAPPRVGATPIPICSWNSRAVGPRPCQVTLRCSPRRWQWTSSWPISLKAGPRAPRSGSVRPCGWSVPRRITADGWFRSRPRCQAAVSRWRCRCSRGLSSPCVHRPVRAPCGWRPWLTAMPGGHTTGPVTSSPPALGASRLRRWRPPRPGSSWSMAALRRAGSGTGSCHGHPRTLYLGTSPTRWHDGRAYLVAWGWLALRRWWNAFTPSATPRRALRDPADRQGVPRSERTTS